LSEDLAAKRAAETAQASKTVKLESVAVAQAQRITELEGANANLKLEKENVIADYRRLAEKYKKLEEKSNAVSREKADAAEAHVA
jgi:uncharacterized coiled-coil protein SlyX